MDKLQNGRGHNLKIHVSTSSLFKFIKLFTIEIIIICFDGVADRLKLSQVELELNYPSDFIQLLVK